MSGESWFDQLKSIGTKLRSDAEESKELTPISTPPDDVAKKEGGRLETPALPEDELSGDGVNKLATLENETPPAVPVGIVASADVHTRGGELINLADEKARRGLGIGIVPSATSAAADRPLASVIPLESHQGDAFVTDVQTESSISIEDQLRGRIQRAKEQIEVLFQQHPELRTSQLIGLPKDLIAETEASAEDIVEGIWEQREDPEILASGTELIEAVLGALEQAVAKSAGSKSSSSASVESRETVIHTPEKGDVFVNPKTNQRMVVEGIREKDGETIVLFSLEIDTDVRQEPGEKLHQLPLANFEVQRLTGGYTEPDPVINRNFDEVFGVSQDALETVIDLLKTKRDSLKHADLIKDCEALKSGPFEEIRNIGNAWKLLEQEGKTKHLGEKALLFAQLKKIIGQFPDYLVKLFPVLERVRKEYLALTEAHESNLEEVSSGPKGRRDGKKQVSSQPGEKLGDKKKSQIKGTRRQRDMASLDLAAHGQQVARWERARRTERVDFSQYDQDNESWLGAWQARRGDSTQSWIDAVRERQDHLDAMIDVLAKLDDGIALWEERMRVLGPDYQQFAKRRAGMDVSEDLATIKAQFTKEAAEDETDEDVAARRAKTYTEAVPRMKGYLFRYLDLLRAGNQAIVMVRNGEKPAASGIVAGKEAKSEPTADRKNKRGKGGDGTDGTEPGRGTEGVGVVKAERDAALFQSTMTEAERKTWWEENKNKLPVLVDSVRYLQREFQMLATEIERVFGLRELEKMLDGLSLGHKEFAKSGNVNAVVDKMNKIEGMFPKQKLDKDQLAERARLWAKVQGELNDYITQFHEILVAGRSLLATAPKDRGDVRTELREANQRTPRDRKPRATKGKPESQATEKNPRQEKEAKIETYLAGVRDAYVKKIGGILKQSGIDLATRRILVAQGFEQMIREEIIPKLPEKTGVEFVPADLDRLVQRLTDGILIQE